MSRKSFLCLMLSLSMLLIAFSGCAGKEKDGAGTTTAGGTTAAAETEAPAPKAVLASLTLDGGYSVAFDPAVASYTVELPAGRPAIPHVTAEGKDGAAVSVTQATIADGETSGKAVITASKEGETKVYEVNFVKTDAKGFVLQFEDVYKFVPEYKLGEGEKFTFESSKPKTLSVDKDGNVKALKLSSKALTVTAKVGDREVGTLTVDKIVKAPINIFLLIGQSNAFGYHDVPAGQQQGVYFKKQADQFDKPETTGRCYADNDSTSYDEMTFTEMYDLCRTKGTSGLSSPLAKEWYNLTGEKVLMLRTAVGSSPIEAWTPDPGLQFFGLDLYGKTVERFNYYKEKFSAEDSGFTINRVYAFWLQGETCEEYVYDPSEHTWADKKGIKNYKYLGDWNNVSKNNKLMTTKEYYNYFMEMYNGLVRDVGLEFMGILPVRAMTSVASAENKKEEQLVDLVAPRAAQFALNYTECPEIAIVTLKTDLARTEAYPDPEAEGYGWIGCNNIHYNQTGYNAIGKDAAYNTYYRVSAVTDKTASDIRIYDTNGRDILADGATLTLQAGKSHQITGITLPIYAEAKNLTFTVADTGIATVNAYGVLKGGKEAAGKSTTLTVTNGVVTKTITLTVE